MVAMSSTSYETEACQHGEEFLFAANINISRPTGRENGLQFHDLCRP